MPVLTSAAGQLVPVEVVERRILLIRGHIDRFPEDFMFRLNQQEFEDWRSQIVMSNTAAKMALRRSPYAFTEQGVAMLSSVLNSKRAIAVNIAIIRTFVRLRQLLATHKDLAEKLEAMEKKYDEQFKVVFDILGQLMEPPEPPKHPIGFVGPVTA